MANLTCLAQLKKRKPVQTQRMQDYKMKQLTVGSGREWRCPVQSCGRVLKSAPGVKYHMKSHDRQESFICDICHKPFQRYGTTFKGTVWNYFVLVKVLILHNERFLFI